MGPARLVAYVASTLIACQAALRADSIFLESAGQVVVEAETYTLATPALPHHWFIVPFEAPGFPSQCANFRGDGYIQILPDQVSGGGGPLQPPLVEYKLLVQTPGQYRLYVRWSAFNDNSDTFYASINELKDGVGGAIADWYRYVRIAEDLNFASTPTWFGSGGFEKTDSPFTNGESPVVWNLTDPGYYTLQFSMREDGAAIDAFVFQLASLPAPIGFGPPSSAVTSELAIQAQSLPSALLLGQVAQIQASAIGGVSPYSWSIAAGQLPPGLQLSTEGKIEGVPTAVGAFASKLQVTDNGGDSAHFDLSIAITLTPPPPDIQVYKSGTTPVPGRELDYFIVVHNGGVGVANDVHVVELLNPEQFTLTEVAPEGAMSLQEMAALNACFWEIPLLEPQGIKAVSYSAKLSSMVSLGTIVTGGPACASSQQSLAWVYYTCAQEAYGVIDDCSTALACALGCAAVCADPPTVWACLGCVSLCAVLSQPCAKAVHDFMTECIESLENTDCDSDEQPAVGPIDPNELVVTPAGFVQGDQTLLYAVHFENIGSVEAIDVFIDCALDNGLDISTIEVLTPDGAFVDTKARTISWDLLGINLGAGKTGNVLFSVKPIAGLMSGTDIRCSATIQFEIFTPIGTNETVSIIDTTAPVSNMTPLSPVANATSFSLEWDGLDPIGLIEAYTVFVSKDGGGFEPFLPSTPSNSASFIGVPGAHYDFFVVAVDSVGNVEEKVVRAETGISVPPDSDGDGVLDNVDDCPMSILGGTVTIGHCDSGVVNKLVDNGCMLSDKVMACVAASGNPMELHQCMRALMARLMNAGVIDPGDQKKLMGCVEQVELVGEKTK